MSSAMVKNAFEIGEKKFQMSIVSFDCVFYFISLSDSFPFDSFKIHSYSTSLFLFMVLNISFFSNALASDLDSTSVSSFQLHPRVQVSGGSLFKTSSMRSKKF